jgi:hypothetical protein
VKVDFFNVRVACRRHTAKDAKYAKEEKEEIRFFSHLVFLLETLVNQRLLGNETALLGKGGKRNLSSSLPFKRGGLGWGNSRTGSDSITCVYTVADKLGGFFFSLPP